MRDSAWAWSSGVESLGMSSSGVVEEGVGVGFSGAILAVISESWASRELAVEKASGRERVRFTVRWKARRSCLRRAVRV